MLRNNNYKSDFRHWFPLWQKHWSGKTSTSHTQRKSRESEWFSISQTSLRPLPRHIQFSSFQAAEADFFTFSHVARYNQDYQTALVSKICRLLKRWRNQTSGDSRIKKCEGGTAGQGKSSGANINVDFAWWFFVVLKISCYHLPGKFYPIKPNMQEVCQYRSIWSIVIIR